jgi:hypothetical protein
LPARPVELTGEIGGLSVARFFGRAGPVQKEWKRIVTCRKGLAFPLAVTERIFGWGGMKKFFIEDIIIIMPDYLTNFIIF